MTCRISLDELGAATRAAAAATTAARAGRAEVGVEETREGVLDARRPAVAALAGGRVVAEGVGRADRSLGVGEDGERHQSVVVRAGAPIVGVLPEGSGPTKALHEGVH